MTAGVLTNVFCLIFMFLVVQSKDIDKEEVDKVIEDEITQKLSEDLLQSIEKKFHVDLERSVDSVLTKIKLLLQNGTTHIQERLADLQGVLESMKRDGEGEVDSCLSVFQNETTGLAEKALHQMVVCGYALIGHDPAQAVRNVMELKAMIKHGLKPMYEKRDEVYKLLRVCGHDHDSLKKVIKCVISKSPQLKSAMMGVSGKLIDGVVHLTKQMAHGAMHEACLIEVINSVEEEAFVLMNKVKKCVFRNDSRIQYEIETLLKENNATEIDRKRESDQAKLSDVDKDDLDLGDKKDDIKEPSAKDLEMKTMLRRMLKDSQNSDGLQTKVKESMLKLKNELGSETNAIISDIKNINDMKSVD